MKYYAYKFENKNHRTNSKSTQRQKINEVCQENQHENKKAVYKHC